MTDTTPPASTPPAPLEAAEGAAQAVPFDPADILAGALQCSRAYAYDLMERAVAGRDAPGVAKTLQWCESAFSDPGPAETDEWTAGYIEARKRAWRMLTGLTSPAEPAAAAKAEPVQGANPTMTRDELVAAAESIGMRFPPPAAVSVCGWPDCDCLTAICDDAPDEARADFGPNPAPAASAAQSAPSAEAPAGGAVPEDRHGQLRDKIAAMFVEAMQEVDRNGLLGGYHLEGHARLLADTIVGKSKLGLKGLIADYASPVGETPAAAPAERQVAAFQLLKTALQADPEYAWSWHCNLAMPIMDGAKVSHRVANETAARLMHSFFDIDTSKHQHYAVIDCAPAEPVALREASGMRQLSAADAIAFYESGEWESMPLLNMAMFQLQQDHLCMPFGKFREAAESVLERNVYTSEFANRRKLLSEAMQRVKYVDGRPVWNPDLAPAPAEAAEPAEPVALPPLPEPGGFGQYAAGGRSHSYPFFTTAQMHAYALAALAGGSL